MGDAPAHAPAHARFLLGGQSMSLHVEIYAAGGIGVGVVAGSGHLRDVLDGSTTLAIQGAVWHPLDDSPPRQAGEIVIPPDDVHVATTEEAEDLPVHAQWHDIALEVGPYRVTGQMPTMPGFDPGRALARPTGEFVQLRDVTIGLLADPPGSGLSRSMAVVNRYVVDRVEADLMLGFYFPGAEMVSTARTAEAAPVPPAAAPPPASPAV
jgi:hypothetical protein